MTKGLYRVTLSSGKIIDVSSEINIVTWNETERFIIEQNPTDKIVSVVHLDEEEIIMLNISSLNSMSDEMLDTEAIRLYAEIAVFFDDEELIKELQEQVLLIYHERKGTK